VPKPRMATTINTPALDEAVALRALEALEQDSRLSQRALSREQGVSLGKTNYCPRADR